MTEVYGFSYRQECTLQLIKYSSCYSWNKLLTAKISTLSGKLHIYKQDAVSTCSHWCLSIKSSLSESQSIITAKFNPSLTMKLVLIGLVFSAFVASTLAMPSFDDNRKAERDTFKNAFLQYWMRTMMNGELCNYLNPQLNSY